MALGPRIEERIRALGLTQSELARRADVPQTTVNSLVKGKARSTPHLVKIARALQTSPAYLTGETDDLTQFPEEAELSEQDRNWLNLLHSLSPRDLNAVLVLARTLAGVGEPVPPPPLADEALQIPTLQSPKLEFRGQ